MVTPLYGETSRKTKIAYIAIGAVAGVFALVTLIVDIAFGAMHNARNIVLGVSVVSFFVAILILVLWYRKDQLDPKFKKLIIILGCFYFFFNISVLIVVTYVDPAGQCDGLYVPSTGQCYAINLPQCRLLGCFNLNSGFCYNCSARAIQTWSADADASLGLEPTTIDLAALLGTDA